MQLEVHPSHASHASHAWHHPITMHLLITMHHHAMLAVPNPPTTYHPLPRSELAVLLSHRGFLDARQKLAFVHAELMHRGGYVPLSLSLGLIKSN